MVILLFRDDEDGVQGEEVREEMDLATSAEIMGTQDLIALLAAKVTEILDREEAQVRRTVPGIRQGRHDRRAAAKAKQDAGFDMREIRESDNGFLADPERFGDHGLDLLHFLQTLVEDHIIKGLVRIIRQAAVDIAMENAQAFFHASVDRVIIQFNALRLDLFPLGQKMQKVPCPTAKIQHFGSRLDDVADNFMVELVFIG